MVQILIDNDQLQLQTTDSNIFIGTSQTYGYWDGGGSFIAQSQTGQNVSVTGNFNNNTTGITSIVNSTGISVVSNTTSITASSQNTGSGTNYMPPYYVLTFIMRII